jgi:hypothetical protein
MVTKHWDRMVSLLPFSNRVRVIVKDNLMCVFHNFHEHGLFEKILNAIFVTLISPERLGSWKGFLTNQPSGSVYKILAKVLAIRMKQVLGSLISNNHNAFVEGRHS